MGLKEDFELFCSGTSLRGMARTVKAPTRPLRVLWSVYAVLMAASLVTCVCFIVVDYLTYKTVIQTTMVLNDPGGSWPAVTVCNHYPFSEAGRELWRSGRVPTPTNFSRSLRQEALKLFNAGDFLGAEELLASDSRRIYYQNLDPADAVSVSFSAEQLFIFCISGAGSLMELSGGGDCFFKLKLISLPNFFNCFQVQAPSSIDWLTLVLRVSRGSHPAEPHEEAFVQDVFQQASGFRVQLQEHDKFPEPADKGIHVAPGKMVEIAFQPVRWLEVGSPSDVCLPEAAAAEQRIHDLGQDFAYSHEGCLRQALGRQVLRACRCHYASYLRETLPNSSHPYCGDYRRGVGAVLKHRECLQALNLAGLRAHLSDSACLKPCHYHDFETVASKTVWRSTTWQLHWLSQQSRLFRELEESANILASAETTPEHRKRTEESMAAAERKMRGYLTSGNLTAVPATPSGLVLPVGSDFAYVTVRRQSSNTIQKAETLSLSFSALMSQIGGLSSLFLGLTCAFFVELLELGLLKRHFSKTAARSAEAASNALVPQQTPGLP